MNTETKEYIEPMGFKGTKGEWRLIMSNENEIKYVDSIRVKEWGKCDLMGDYRGCVVADFIESHGMRDHAFDEAKANAILLSNAKELLKALQNAQKRVEQLINLTPTSNRRDKICDENIEILSIINKALNINQ